MNLVLGVALLLLATLLRAGHEAVRRSSRIWLRHMVDENDGAITAELHLEHPGYLRAAVFAWESALAISGSILLATEAIAAISAAVVIPLLLLSALIFAAVNALVGSLARAAHARVFPLIAPVLDFTTFVSTRLFPPLSRKEYAAAAAAYATEDGEREAMEELIEDGLREGIGDREDMELVSGVVELRDTPVKDVMVKREDIFAISADLSPNEIARRIAASGYSRVPIYSGSLDSVAGIFHVLDVLKLGPHDLPPLRPIVTVDEQERCGALLHRLLRQHAHICVVTDGGGHTTGLVTLEDLLEEIVGDIRDEFDEPVPASAGTRSSER